jgi:hypothetical protein
VDRVGRQIQSVPGTERDVSIIRVKHDGSLDAVQHLVLQMIVGGVLDVRPVRPLGRIQALIGKRG